MCARPMIKLFFLLGKIDLCRFKVIIPELTVSCIASRSELLVKLHIMNCTAMTF